MKSMNKGLLIMSIFLNIAAALGISGCTPDTPSDNPVCGGTTVKTDENAPKEIVSKDITGMDVGIRVITRWTNDRDGEEEYHFVVENDENGVLTVNETEHGLSHAADEEILKDIQGIIDKNKLALDNGVYEVTAGLPPEFQPRTFEVNYASGEKLSFTVNNDPEALWAEEMFDAFAAWFEKNGDDSLYPPKEESMVNHLLFWYTEDNVFKDFNAVTVQEDEAIDGERNLLEYRLSDSNGKLLEEKFVKYPIDYYEKVTEILSKYDPVTKYDFSIYDRKNHNFGNHSKGYFGWGDKTTSDEEADSENDKVELSIEYESEKTLNIKTAKPSEIEGMKPLINELLEYHESLFD